MMELDADQVTHLEEESMAQVEQEADDQDLADILELTADKFPKPNGTNITSMGQPLARQ
jgi:hypothetical protein